jgi:cytochrome c2
MLKSATLAIRWCLARPAHRREPLRRGRPRCRKRPEFEDSDALEALPARNYGAWTEADLHPFLKLPEDFAPGTATTFVGPPDPRDRQDLIAHPVAQAGGGQE